MKKLNNTQKSAMIALFFFLIGILIALIIALLPKGFVIIVIFLVFIGIYFLYNKFIVRILGLEMAWWSPHPKILDLKGKITKKIDPEIVIISYFLDNNFENYYKLIKKKGFEIGGYNKGVNLRAKFNKDHLKINFTPYISKKTIKEMKKFKSHLLKNEN